MFRHGHGDPQARARLKQSIIPSISCNLHLRSSRLIRDQTWMPLYFCNSSLFPRHRAPEMTSPGTVLATSVSYGPTRVVTTEGRYMPSVTCWTCTRAICLSTTLHLLSNFSAACMCTKSPHLCCLSLYSLVYMPQWTPVGYGYTKPNTLICRWTHPTTQTIPPCLYTITHP